MKYVYVGTIIVLYYINSIGSLTVVVMMRGTVMKKKKLR